MNYINKIAFLGKRKLQDYGPKSNNWIKLSDDGVLNWEAIKTSGINMQGTRSIPDNYIHTDGKRFRTGEQSGWILEHEGWDFYYRPDIDLLLIYPDYNRAVQNVEAVLGYLNDMTLDEIEKLHNDELPRELLK